MIRSFIDSAVSLNCALGDTDRLDLLKNSKRFLIDHPELANEPLPALISGNSEPFESHVQAGTFKSNEPVGPHDWLPLLYVCFSRFWFDSDPKTTAGLLKNADRLLYAGADANSYFMIDDAKETCLYGAVGVAGNADLARLLITHGAEVNDGEVAYHAAEFSGSACAKVLFENGLSPTHQATLLLRKLDFDDLEGTREILQLGADPDGMGMWGKTPLHQAIMRGRCIATIRLILSFGADPKIPMDNGKSTLELATEANRGDLIALLGSV